MGSGAGVQPQAGREAEDRRRGTLPLLRYAQFLPVLQPFSRRKTFSENSSQEGWRVLRGNCCAASGCPPPAGAAGSLLPILWGVLGSGEVGRGGRGRPLAAPQQGGSGARAAAAPPSTGSRQPAPLPAAMHSPRRHPRLLAPDLFVFFCCRQQLAASDGARTGLVEAEALLRVAGSPRLPPATSPYTPQVMGALPAPALLSHAGGTQKSVISHQPCTLLPSTLHRSSQPAWAPWQLQPRLPHLPAGAQHRPPPTHPPCLLLPHSSIKRLPLVTVHL